MEYKIVPSENRTRYVVIEENSYLRQKRCAVNLEDGERRINFFEATDCPKERICVNIDDKCSSICKYFGSFADKIRCRAEKGENYLDAKLLSAEGCPRERKNCIGCEYFEDANFHSHPEKSHTYVICSHS